MHSSGGGTLTIKVVEAKLYRDTETFGYLIYHNLLKKNGPICGY